MRQVKIGDITEVLTGQSAPQDPNAFGESGIPFIRAGSLQGLQNGKREEDFELINQDFAKKYRLKLFPKNTVIFAKSGMSAKLGRIYRLKTPSYLVSHLAAILPSEDLNPGYLERWLHKNPTSRLIPNDAYPSIKTSSIASMKIELPELGYQEHVAKILDKADVLRQKRKESIKLLDDYLRSTFLEMFGDSFLNDKNWPTINLKDSCLEVVDCPHSTPKYSGVDEIYPCIRTTEIRDGHIDWSSMKYVDELQYNERIKRLTPLPGDIIYGREGSFGDAIVIPKNEKMCLGQRVMLFRPNSEMYNNLFFWCLIRSKGLFHMALQKNNGATVGHVNVGDIKLFSLIKPPIEFQIKFANIVKQVEKLKAKYKESEKELDNLFGSLMQRAFKGEL